MTEIKLCSEFDPVTTLVCDLPKGHKGPHSARAVWGDENDYEGDDD